MGEIYPCRSPFDEEDFVGGLLAEESPEQCAMSVENGDGVGDGVEDRVRGTAGGRKVVLVVGAIWPICESITHFPFIIQGSQAEERGLPCTVQARVAWCPPPTLE